MEKKFWEADWQKFKSTMPYLKKPFSQRNWGSKLHSLCSYQGKLKPAIAYYLVNIFVPNGGKLLDPFCGSGTIPLEGALNGKITYSFDLSELAYVITKAKVENVSKNLSMEVIKELSTFIKSNSPTTEEVLEAKTFGFNGKIADYYHEKTLNEILLARRFFIDKIGIKNLDASGCLVLASLLHILHGNRPYALSRHSHPLTPYAPTGPTEYKSLIDHLSNKVNRVLEEKTLNELVQGKVFLQDSTKSWPIEVKELDAVITSPPFLSSIRFYFSNWLRLWFVGWSKSDFNLKSHNFLEEKQKTDFLIYDTILKQSKERLKENGVLLFHLGRNKTDDMANKMLNIANKYFYNYDIFYEDVKTLEHHGIRDKGSTTSHSYLLLY